WLSVLLAGRIAQPYSRGPGARLARATPPAVAIVATTMASCASAARAASDELRRAPDCIGIAPTLQPRGVMACAAGRTSGRSGSCVGGDLDAVADGLRAEQAHRLLLTRLGEQALAASEHDREDHQAQLVHEIVLDQRLHELR